MSRVLKRYLYIFFFFMTLVSSASLSAANDGSRYASNSMLAQGVWYKIKISETGVYKLSYDDLKRMGLSNPANVKIYGYGGWILDEDFSKAYVDDLPQVSIWMSKDRSSFGQGDYVLFYGRGGVKWEYNPTDKEFQQTQNPYSHDSFYFITESNENPSLIETQSSLPPTENIRSTFDDYLLHEKELINVGETGRNFYGENFITNNNQTFTLNTEGATSDPASVRYDFISRASLSSGRLRLTFNGAFIDEYATLVPTSYYTFATNLDHKFEVSLQGQNTLNLVYARGSASDRNVYLNYIRVNYKRHLKPYGAVTLFRSADLTESLTFQVGDASNSVMIFDVTGNTSVKRMDGQLSGSTLSFTTSNSSIREYALVDLSKTIPSPEVVGKINNQDLHAKTGYDMIIIVRPLLQKYAEQLAKIHEEDSGLKSLIVNPEDIFNEFSSGKPDITAYRRFVKMFYDRASDVEGSPKYLLLFGGGTFDNRLSQNVWSDVQKKSMLLTYQTTESLEDGASFTTDDYLGFLDDSEGGDMKNAHLDIGIGRLPVRTESDAANVVQKIQRYIANQNKGIWQNNITYIADDMVTNHNTQDETDHIEDAETFANYTGDTHPDFIVNKIYEDAYERVLEVNGARYPAAKKALLDKINNGTLALNFIGHGAIRSWTHENLLTYSDIQGMNNEKLALWITATCDFSRYDANTSSGGELAILKSNGGAIALISTVRLVLMAKNTVLNMAISKHLLDRKDGKPARLGDIIKNAKLELKNDENKLKFTLLGDPALRLAFTDDTYRVEVAEMNGIDASTDGINIQALDNVTITGHVLAKDGSIATGFNGILESVVFDAEQSLKTLGNNYNGVPNDDRATKYNAYTNTLFSGKVAVVNGEFRIEFTAPKDIQYTNTKGKISFYAHDDNGLNKAQGSFYNYTVGGTNTNAPEESNAPVIEKMFLNNEQFVSGGIVGTTPKFHAVISDDTGINLTNAIGHNLELIVDGKTEYDMTPYFENEGGSSKKGSITFRLPELSAGSHSLELRVFDVWNNSTYGGLDFVVTTENSPSSYDFQIWGNPAVNETKFVFTTENAGTDITVKLSAYSLTGRMVWTHEEKGGIDHLNRYEYTWYLNSNGGARLIPGVYICTGQIIVNGKTSSIKSQKLIITNY